MNEPSPQIRRILGGLRARIRAYVWLEGIAAVLAVVGLAFWISLALDWMFEPPPAVRLVGIIIVAAITAWVIYRYIISRAFARLNDSSMAVIIERRFQDFHDSLLTSVELRERPDRASSFSPEMLEHTRHEAEAKTGAVKFSQLFDPRPVVYKGAAAVLLIASIVIFSVFASDAFGVGVDRLLRLSEQQWPRKTRLTVEGFEENEKGVREEKIARGSSLDLKVNAEVGPERVVPDQVEIRWTDDGGNRGRGDMSRRGRAIRGRDDFQEYTYTFQDVFESRTFEIRGGDARVRDLRLTVVERPEIVRSTILCQYPDYMKRPPANLAVTGAMAIPEGSHLVLEATSTKPLADVKILDSVQKDPTVINVDPESGDPRQFSYTIDRLDADRVLYFELLDVDGIRTPERDRHRIALSVIPDEVPEVSVQLSGISNAVTASARIPVVGKLSDDYGIEKAWFEHRIDNGEPTDTAVVKDAGARDSLPIDAAFDLRDVEVLPDQKLLLTLMASDLCTLGEGPREGTSQRFLLDVVTADKLRAMLEGRELMLRKRFQTIYDGPRGSMTDTRDILARIDFSPPEETELEDTGLNNSNDESDTDPDAEQEDPNEADAAVEEPEDPLARAIARRRTRVVRSLQQIELRKHETQSVAEGFDDIYKELVNNRLDTEELRRRLIGDISEPLKKLATERFPELEQQLKDLESVIDDEEQGPAELEKMVQMTDAVLVEMKTILDRMLELEGYNELMEELREIIKIQAEINERTKDRRKDDLRKLLE